MFWLNLLLLALGAFGLTFNTLALIKIEGRVAWQIGILSALLTLLAYLAMRSRLIFRHSHEMKSSLSKPLALTLLFTIGTAVLLLSFELFYQNILGWQHAAVMLITGTLTFLYFIPVSLKRDGKRLRDIYWLKHFLVGANWSFATVAFPAGFSNFAIVSGLFTQVFLLISALSLSFDLRDVNLDTIEKHRSFYISAGERKLKSLAVVLLLCCAIVLPFYVHEIKIITFRIVLLIISALLILKAKPNDASNKFNIVLESFIFFYALAAWL